MARDYSALIPRGSIGARLVALIPSSPAGAEELLLLFFRAICRQIRRDSDSVGQLSRPSGGPGPLSRAPTPERLRRASNSRRVSTRTQLSRGKRINIHREHSAVKAQVEIIARAAPCRGVCQSIAPDTGAARSLRDYADTARAGSAGRVFTRRNTAASSPGLIESQNHSGKLDRP